MHSTIISLTFVLFLSILPSVKAQCAIGYAYANGNCVKACLSPNGDQNPSGGCNCHPGFGTYQVGLDCVAYCTQPHRFQAATGGCAGCVFNYEEINGVCQPTCDDRYYVRSPTDPSKCLAKCTQSGGLQDYVNGFCNGCQPNYREENGYCIRSDCPDGTIDLGTGVCIPECTDPNGYTTPTVGGCSCDLTYFKSPSSGLCIATCNDPNAQQDTINGGCSTCNDGYQKSGSTCIPTCTDAQIRAPDGIGCVARCNDISRIQDSNGGCSTSCNTAQGYTNVMGNCVIACTDPNGVQLNGGGCRCKNGYTQTDTGNGLCVVTCTDPNAYQNPQGSCGDCVQGFERSGNTCIQTCTSNQIRAPDGISCVAQCNDISRVQDPNGGCSTACNTAQGYTDIMGSCVIACTDPNGVQLNGGGCRCKDGFTQTDTGNGLCVVTCTDPNAYQSPQGACGDCVQGYERVGTICRAVCPSGTTRFPPQGIDCAPTCEDPERAQTANGCGNCYDPLVLVGNTCAPRCTTPNRQQDSSGCGDCVRGYVPGGIRGTCVAFCASGNGSQDPSGGCICNYGYFLYNNGLCYSPLFPNLIPLGVLPLVPLPVVIPIPPIDPLPPLPIPDPVDPDDDPTDGPTDSETPTGSGNPELRRKRKRAQKAFLDLAARKMDMIKHAGILSATLCGGEKQACLIPGGKLGAYECLDTSSDMESCGGCASHGYGVDCTRIRGANNVTCQSGLCFVASCSPGYKLVKNEYCISTQKRPQRNKK